MSQRGWAFATVLLIVASAATTAADDSCSKYREFQDAWAKLKDPVAAGLSLEDQQRLTSLYDPRRLNTDDIRNCTSNETPSDDQQNVVIQSWPTGEYDYRDVLRRSLYFYEAQRSGALPAQCSTTNNPAVNTLTCTRPAWRGNSAMGDADGKDLRGGYYDAGDMVKFGLPAATAMAQLALGLLEFKDGYVAAGQWDRGLATLRWALDYMVKAHSVSSDPSVLVAQVGNGGADHAYWGRPEDMTMPRPAYTISSSAPGTDLWAATAAALAGGAAVFKSSNPTLAATYLTHAQQLYNVAKTANKGIYSQSVPDAASFYSSSGWQDDLALAAAMLYVAQPSAAALNEAKAQYDAWAATGAGWEAWDWDNAQWGATYILQKYDPSHASSRSKAEGFMSAWLNKARTPKGLAYMTQWASLRGPVNAAFMMALYANAPANANNPKRQAQLSCWAQTQLRYALGDAGRSFVVGFGNNPPTQPHHRGASCPNRPAPCSWDNFNINAPNPQTLFGALVGGPDQNDNFDDRRSDYVRNEVATDYNAGFSGTNMWACTKWPTRISNTTGALAAMALRRANYATTCQCMCTGSNSCSGGTNCPINWVTAGPTPSPRRPSPAAPRPPSPTRPPSPAAPVPPVRPPSPAVRPPSPRVPTPPPPPQGCPVSPTITRPAWAQCGGKGGECPACAQGQCSPTACKNQDSVWTNVGCAATPWGARTGCCRVNEWYWQCMELSTTGTCPNNAALCTVTGTLALRTQPVPYVTESQAKELAEEAREAALQRRQDL